MWDKLSEVMHLSSHCRTALEPAFRLRDVSLSWQGLCDVRQSSSSSGVFPVTPHKTEYDNSMPQIRWGHNVGNICH